VFTNLLAAVLFAANVQPAPSPAPSGDDAVALRAKAALASLQTGVLDRTEFAPSLNALLTPAVVATDRRELPPGAPLAFSLRSKSDTGGTTTYVFRARWAAGTADLTFGTDDATGKIDTLFTRPGPPV